MVDSISCDWERMLNEKSFKGIIIIPYCIAKEEEWG